MIDVTVAAQPMQQEVTVQMNNFYKDHIILEVGRNYFWLSLQEPEGKSNNILIHIFMKNKNFKVNK